jgi:hypothetical protein
MTKEQTSPQPGSGSNDIAESESGDDYNGMAFEEWKRALRLDVARRFGPTPDNLKPAGKAGW